MGVGFFFFFFGFSPLFVGGRGSGLFSFFKKTQGGAFWLKAQDGAHIPKTSSADAGIYFIPEIVPLLILCVLKPEPWGPPGGVSVTGGQQVWACGLRFLSRDRADPGGGVSNAPIGEDFPFRSFRGPKSECPGPCFGGLAGWNENSGRMLHELSLGKGTHGPLGSSGPKAHMRRQQPRGWLTGGRAAGASPSPLTARSQRGPPQLPSFPLLSSRGSAAQGTGVSDLWVPGQRRGTPQVFAGSPLCPPPQDTSTPACFLSSGLDSPSPLPAVKAIRIPGQALATR